MKFVNLSNRPLKFDLASAVYECDVAGSVDIPDSVAFCVKLHGIPLTPASEVEPVEPVKPAPAKVSEQAELQPVASEKKRK